MKYERDKRVLALRALGWTQAAIALEVGIQKSVVSRICTDHSPLPGDRTAPECMSILTAREIYSALGIWPSAETAEVISKRAMEVMLASRRRDTMSELGAWLGSLGYPR